MALILCHFSGLVYMQSRGFSILDDFQDERTEKIHFNGQLTFHCVFHLVQKPFCMPSFVGKKDRAVEHNSVCAPTRTPPPPRPSRKMSEKFKSLFLIPIFTRFSRRLTQLSMKEHNVTCEGRFLNLRQHGVVSQNRK